MDIGSPKFKLKLKRALLLSAGWSIAAGYIFVLQFTTLLIEFSRNAPVEFNFIGGLILTVVEVFIAGLLPAVFEVFYFTDRFRNKSFGYAVLMKTLFYTFGLSILTALVSIAEYYFLNEHFNSTFYDNSFGVFLTFFKWAPVFLISTFVMQVSDKFGHGVLWKFLLGKYHIPKVETRIFMFLDLKSSTSIAEALGHIKYFELINDFFYDVTDAIIETHGEIYQYVGDEIVISWTLKNGTNDENCLNCFFDITDVIRKLSEKYESKYGLVPSFKAGMHYGEVTVGEIGVMKRDIVFSGDVLNTTARIQELCNKYKVKLILSKDLLELLKVDNTFLIKELGQMNLRGRSAPVILYSVRKERF
ncbi:MAG: adenylate/guanylate cyclase domain-containing protein [Ignavibacteria bacterium]